MLLENLFETTIYLAEISLFLNLSDVQNLSVTNHTLFHLCDQSIWLHFLRHHTRNWFQKTDFVLTAKHLQFYASSLCNQFIELTGNIPWDPKKIFCFQSRYPFPFLNLKPGWIERLFCRISPRSNPHFLFHRERDLLTFSTNIFYMEVLIQKIPTFSYHEDLEPLITIGFISQKEEDPRFLNYIGWNDTSIGYHSDDGGIFHFGQKIGTGPKFTTGAIIGCGIDYSEHVVFFTFNGSLVFEYPVPRIFYQKPITPILMHDHSDWEFHVNFGTDPFYFTILN